MNKEETMPSDAIQKQIDAENGAQPPAPSQPHPFPPAVLARARGHLQTIQMAQMILNELLIGYFHGERVDPEVQHIQHDLQAGTYTVLDAPPEGR